MPFSPLPPSGGHVSARAGNGVPEGLIPWPLAAPHPRHNDNKSFLVWVNEEDHLRVISMEKGGNMKEVFRRFCVGLQKVGAGPWRLTSDPILKGTFPFQGPAPWETRPHPYVQAPPKSRFQSIFKPSRLRILPSSVRSGPIPQNLTLPASQTRPFRTCPGPHPHDVPPNTARVANVLGGARWR